VKDDMLRARSLDVDYSFFWSHVRVILLLLLDCLSALTLSTLMPAVSSGL